MTSLQQQRRRGVVLWAGALCLALGSLPAQAKDMGGSFHGKRVAIGKGHAYTVVHADSAGKPTALGVEFTAGALEGLPQPKPGMMPVFPYALAMPAKGPKTVVNHVMLDWEALGHPPPKVYDVPHFDFHFYLVGRGERMKVHYHNEAESGTPAQQPPAGLLPKGYVVPPGTAVPQMGVHAIDPAGPEFNGQPFNATFIYGYHDQKLTFLEPMASIAFLKTMPDFSAEVARPMHYSKPGLYPSRYSVRFDKARKVYQVMLEELK